MNHVLSNSFFSVTVAERGAELQSIRRVSDGREYLWQGDPAVWQGRSPMLFPVVGQLKGDGFTWQGVRYALAKHGFAQQSAFEAEKTDETHLRLTLRDSEETRAHYPFAFELSLAYELNKNRLALRYSVRNPADGPMYFSLGAHPGLCCEMGDKLVFERAETAGFRHLRREAGMLLSTDKQPLLNDTDTLVLQKDTFAHDALIFDDLRSRFVTLHRADGGRVKVDFGGAPCLGLWAKPGASYVCVEPWYGIDDTEEATGDITQKPHIVALPAGETFHFTVTLEIA